MVSPLAALFALAAPDCTAAAGATLAASGWLSRAAALAGAGSFRLAIAWPSGSSLAGWVRAVAAVAAAGAAGATGTAGAAGAAALLLRAAALCVTSLLASRAASRLAYIGLFGSCAWPGGGSAGRPALAVLSVNGEAPLVIVRATATAMPRPMIRPMMMPVSVLPRWREGRVRKVIEYGSGVGWNAYIFSGAETPIRARPLRSTWRVAVASARRASLSGSLSSSSHLCAK